MAVRDDGPHRRPQPGARAVGVVGHCNRSPWPFDRGAPRQGGRSKSRPIPLAPSKTGHHVPPSKVEWEYPPICNRCCGLGPWDRRKHGHFFTVLDAVLLQPLPYAHGNRLVMVAAVCVGRRLPFHESWRRGSAADRQDPPVSSPYFSVFGAALVVGRTFSAGPVLSQPVFGLRSQILEGVP